MNPWEVAEDFKNVYRRAFWLAIIENKTGEQRLEEYFMNEFPMFLLETLNHLGTSIINNQRARGKGIKGLWKIPRKKKHRNKFVVPDPETGEMITVETF